MSRAARNAKPAEETAEALVAAEEPSRRRGRPRSEIDPERVADVVEELFARVGYQGVTIEAVAEALSVSRATLYRTARSKEYLLGIVFERMTSELLAEAMSIVENPDFSPRERLIRLMHAQIEAAVRQRDYLFVFFGGGWLPPEFYDRWRKWRREYEEVWTRVVVEAIDAGELDHDDPVVVMRLLTGMTTWVARWYHPEDKYSAFEIAATAVRLVLPRNRSSGPTRNDDRPPRRNDADR
jgi:AcrR family transcriptional regulator